MNAEHLKMLRSLIIGNEEAHAIDFSSLPWSEAALVTPRHAMRTQWNDAAIKKKVPRKGEADIQMYCT